MQKELKEIIKGWEAAGFSVVKGRNNHLKVYSPTGGMVSSMASTPSDHRALMNMRATQRKIIAQLCQ